MTKYQRYNALYSLLVEKEWNEAEGFVWMLWNWRGVGSAICSVISKATKMLFVFMREISANVPARYLFVSISLFLQFGNVNKLVHKFFYSSSEFHS